jgi:L-rhamnose mutarotase
MNEAQALAKTLFIEMRKNLMFSMFDLIKIQNIDEDAKQAFKNLVAKPCKNRQQKFESEVLESSPTWDGDQVIQSFQDLFGPDFLQEIEEIAFISNPSISKSFSKAVGGKVNEVSKRVRPTEAR